MIRPAVAVVLSSWLAGCADVAYYAQAIEGQAEIMAAAHPIQDLVADPATDATLRRQLEQIGAVRDFASRELGLPNNGSYRTYASVSRPYVLWNVFAAPEFSVVPEQWCLLFAGCVRYRGYFEQRSAERFAETMRARGFDTYVGGVSAYSTLGYFDDPVLDTFLRQGEQRATRVIFHELAHQVVYVRGDTAFNESFAVAVEEEGMRRWLMRNADAARLREFEAEQVRSADFQRLIADCREQLRSLYASSLTPAGKAQAKAEAFARLRRAYADQKSRWNGYAGYDRWFAQPLNNALLASTALYTQWLPSFRALLAQEHGDLASFYRRVAQLARLPEAARANALERLASGGMPLARDAEPGVQEDSYK